MSTTSKPASGMLLKDYTNLVLFCKRHGILKLKLGEFEVEFKEDNNVTRSSPKKQIKSKDHKENNDLALLNQEAEMRNRQVDEALIIDPSLAESLILEGKLEDG